MYWSDFIIKGALYTLILALVLFLAFGSVTLVQSAWGEEFPFSTWSEVSNGVFPPSIEVAQCPGGTVFLAQSQAPTGVWFNVAVGESNWFMVPVRENPRPGYQGRTDLSGERLILVKVWEDARAMYEFWTNGCAWLAPEAA